MRPWDHAMQRVARSNRERFPNFSVPVPWFCLVWLREDEQMQASERFISEPLEPIGAAFDADAMARGEPGLPRRLRWRGEEIEILEVLRSWRDTGPCRHGSGERYLRKHWYEVRTASGAALRIYFERQPRGGRKAARWWLYSMLDRR